MKGFRYMDACLWGCIFALLGLQCYRIIQDQEYYAEQAAWMERVGKDVDRYGDLTMRLWEIWGK